MRNKKFEPIAIIFIIGFIGLIIGSFFDLQINKLLYMRGNFIPDFFKFTGEIPMILLVTTSSFIAFRDGFNTLNKFLLGFLVFVFIVFPIGSALSIQSYFGLKDIVITIGLTLAYIVSSILIGRYIHHEDKKLLIRYALFVITSIIVIFLVFTIMKNLWGRMRYFGMFDIDDYTGFKNWWILSGRPESDAFKSFPSGHTSAAASTLVLTLIPYTFKINKDSILNKFCLIFPIIWTLLVGLSRILDGAHFLTDISAGMLIASVFTFLIFNLYFKKTESVFVIK